MKHQTELRDAGGPFLRGPSRPYSLVGPAVSVSLVREPQPLELPPALQSPDEAARALQGLLPDDGRERFGVVFLDVRHRPLGVEVVSVGCLTASLVHPREVFRAAFLVPCSALILWHNHPSGNPEPSAEDLALTRRLATAGTLLGVEVVDHLILGDGTGAWVSLKQRGVI